MSKYLLVVSAAVTICITVGAPRAFANLISNPSFESPVLGSGGFAAYTAANNPVLAPWVIGIGEVELTNSYNAQAASNGVNWLSLESFGVVPFPNNFGSVSQTFATNPGKVYDLKFDYSALSTGNDAQSPWTLTFDVGGPLQFVSISTVGVGAQILSPWLTHEFSFVALGPTTTLTFLGEAKQAGFYGPAIDNVSVLISPVPEPSTFALLGLGVVAMAIKARRRRRTA